MADLAHIVQVKDIPPESKKYERPGKRAFTCSPKWDGAKFHGCQENETMGFFMRCSPCNKKLKTWQRCKEWKKKILKLKLKKSLKFITLTIKNPITFEKQDAREFKPMIMKPWNKLKRRLLRRGTIKGGLYAYEYTYDEQDWQEDLEGESISTFDEFTGEGSMFMPTISNHPHLHIIAVGNYIDQGELLEEWRDCVGHQNAGVHIFAIKNPKHALGYVTKYITKSSESGRNREPFGILRSRKDSG